MEWISVKDKLPQEFKRVLVYSDFGIDSKVFEGGIFYDGETHCYCPIGKVDGVTHWMPLPKPPEKE